MTMTNAALVARAENGAVSDHDPAPKPVRRQFSAAYKASILEQYEGLTDPGEKGALLRREGLYSSHIVDWRRARDAGTLASGKTSSRADKAEIERLKKRNARLEQQLAKHRQALEIQGKASELLSRLLAEGTEETIEQPQRPKR